MATFVADHTISSYFWTKARRRDSALSTDGITLEVHSPQMLRLLEDDKGAEVSHALPPYAPVPAFFVDQYPACPSRWERSSGEERRMAYFVPLEIPDEVDAEDGEGRRGTIGRGLWLDLTRNLRGEYDLAVVMGMEGLNALTRRQMKPPYLERYENRCPEHDVPLGGDRFCPRCKFQWPRQSYLATAASRAKHRSYLWLDGFRTDDGTVRQFFATTDRELSVGIAALGDEAEEGVRVRVYRSRKPRPRSKPVFVLRAATGDSLLDTMGMPTARAFGAIGSNPVLSGMAPPSIPARTTPKDDVESLHVGMGARIRQEVDPDPNGLDYYGDEYSLEVVVYPVLAAQAREIIDAGEREIEAEGPFADLPRGV
jgi:hypothetical protein